MPLRRTHLTASSRLMLLVYPTFSGYVGACYAFGSPARTATPSFDVLRDTMPGGIRTWGFVLLLLTVLKLVALMLGTRRLMIVALCIGFGCYTAWAFGFLVAALTVPLASLVGPVVWGFVAVSHIASLRSITIDSQALGYDR